MADHDDRDRERFLTVAEVTLGVFVYIRELLKALPLPVAVPDLIAEDADHNGHSLLSLDRARVIVRDEPISDEAKKAFDHLIVDWFIAYEMLALMKMAGPAPWRLDAAEISLGRLSIIVEMIDNGEIDGLS